MTLTAILLCVVAALLALLAIIGAGKIRGDVRARQALRTVEPVQGPVPNADKPLPIDPANPPMIRIYHHTSSQPRKRCTCHQIEFKDGERLWWWPLPEGAGVDLFCERTMAEAEDV